MWSITVNRVLLFVVISAALLLSVEGNQESVAKKQYIFATMIQSATNKCNWGPSFGNYPKLRALHTPLPDWRKLKGYGVKFDQAWAEVADHQAELLCQGIKYNFRDRRFEDGTQSAVPQAVSAQDLQKPVNPLNIQAGVSQPEPANQVLPEIQTIPQEMYLERGADGTSEDSHTPYYVLIFFVGLGVGYSISRQACAI